ncbi:ATP-grasp domain-containing protein [Campylobacter sp. MIT 21-1685]|uniref:ATP-grasp domain-containing protein n=1 Tax=unclassified Campylobacter TaxID=2593542 RepID=UPI00224AA1D6|nr:MULTISPECIES: ATP-grasp domain-containing protein [unclassified Campylobacter]MCX2682781.1 ATP-grasp domain-containing protein [Campylobacter sp. MIT 21-1684]MCX2751073.1 ATP-grasp domain-containing protein [Campylobacter sp. MIT 21-1682]MCX2807262.1 ATP-grasp domain-containing protein [Campylobacter sp. MIT 21-1685]
MKKFILLLGANQYLRERALAGARKATDAEVFIADKQGIFNKNRYFDGCLLCDANDTLALIKAVKAQIQKAYQFLGAIPLNDWTLESANELNEYFSLPFLSKQAVENSRNKYKMKLQFEKFKLPSARFFLLEDEKELDEAIAHIGFPLIIKPYDFGGSGGVSVAYNKQEAQNALKQAKELIATHKEGFKIKGDKYLIEEYINSTEEVSVEVLCLKNSYKSLSVTEKYLSNEPYFSEMAHLIPSHRNNNSLLNDLAHKACKALGIDRGLAHIEIKIKDNKMYLIEVGARTGGDGIMDQLENAFEFNPYFLHIASYLGKDLTNFEVPEAKRTSSIAFLKAKKGRIKKINALEKLSLPKELTSIKITTNVGNLSTDAKDWSAREGVVEFVWENHFFQDKTTLPIDLANFLSEQIFELE